MPPFRSKRPSSIPLPPAPHSSPVDHPPPPSSPPSTSSASTSAAAFASTSSAAASSSPSSSTTYRPRGTVVTSAPRTRASVYIANLAQVHGHPRSPTSPRRTRASASGSGSGLGPIPQTPPSQHSPGVSDIAQPSFPRQILPTSVFPSSYAPPSSHMSLLSLALNYLEGAVRLELENNGIVDMLGGANTGTSYSLPGSVVITVPTLPEPLRNRAREVKDLLILLEGKSEFYKDEEGRYTPLRLWSTWLRLATPRNPLRIPEASAGAGSSEARTTVAVTFDIPLPGWLPPSHMSEWTMTSYGTCCKAVIGWVDTPPPTSSSISPLIDDFDLRIDGPSRNTRASARAAAASKKGAFDTPITAFAINTLNAQTTTKCHSEYYEVELRRHRMPKALSLSGNQFEPSLRHYSIQPELDCDAPIEAVISVPDWIDLNGPERSFRISMRLRARAPLNTSSELRAASDDPMDGSTIPGPVTRSGGVVAAVSNLLRHSPKTESVKDDDQIFMHIMELAMEVEETERWTSTVSTAFSQAYPIPPNQPTVRGGGGHTLLFPRQELTSECAGEKPFRAVRHRSCLLADDGSARNFYFTDGGLALGERWRKVNVVLPMPSDTDTQRRNKPQCEMEGPFYRVRHALKIKLVCKAPNAKPDDNGEPCTLSTPIRFGTSPATYGGVRGQKPRPQGLPAYIQLFHENGDLRECDPLPMYTRTADEPIPPCPVALPSRTYSKPGSSPPVSSPPTSSPIRSPIRTRPNLPPIRTAPGAILDLEGTLAAYRNATAPLAEGEDADGEAEYREASIDSRVNTPDPSDSESDSTGPLGRMRAPPPSPELGLAGGTRARASRSAAPPPPPTPRTPGGRKIVVRSLYVAP